MIVQCASCETRFKIGDDKVTDKGVKVRCSKCSAVFVVRKEGSEGSLASSQPPAPPEAIPLPSPATRAPPRSKKSDSARPAPPPLPVDAALSRGETDPFETQQRSDLSRQPSPPPRPLRPDPARPPASPPPGPASTNDPFAGFAAPPLRRAKDGLMPGEFALSAVTPPPPPSPAGATSEVDLLSFGGDAGDPSAVDPAPPLLETDLGPLGGGSASQPGASRGEDPFAAFAAGGSSAPSFPPMAAAYGAEFEGDFDPLAGLSLQGRSSEAAKSGFEVAGAAQAAEAWPPAGGTLEASAQPAPDATGEAGGELKLTGPVAPRRVRLRLAGLPQSANKNAAASAGDAERPLSARIFNALAGTSVVLLALLAFVAYRNGGRIDLRDPLSAFFSAFGFARPTANWQSLPTNISASGFYTNVRGEPLLFVRGSVKNLSGGSAQIGLKLDVLVDGQAVVTVDGLPGLLPTPEDLFNARDAAALAAVSHRLTAASPPRPLAAGQSADFLLVAAQLPASVRPGAPPPEVRVVARALPMALNSLPSSATLGGATGGALHSAAELAAPHP